MNKDYVQGFVDKCATAGIDPEELLKCAQGIPARTPRQFPAYKVGPSKSLLSIYNKTLPALPNPATVAAAPASAPAVAKAPSGFAAGNQKAMMKELLQ